MDRQRTYPNGPRQRRTRESASRQTRLATNHRRLSLFIARIGPVTLSICSVLLMSLMAILYLFQQGQAVTTNQQIQSLHNQQVILQRENDDLNNTIATEQSPEYIAHAASKMGLAPVNPQNVQVSNGDQTGQP